MSRRRPAQVDVQEAATDLSRLLDHVHSGEEVIIAKDGKPYARLAPLVDGEPRKPGLLKGQFRLTKAFFAALPGEELSAWDR